MERSLAKAREAHHKALAMVVTLEEEIEWLSHPLIRSQSESKGDVEAMEDFNLEYPPELGQKVTCFLQGPVKS